MTIIRNIFAAAVLVVSVSGQAHDPSSRKSLDDGIKSADFIFVGRVAKVDYQMSAPTGPGGARIPHTFVTYQIEKVLKGKVASDQVTLRFLGGRGEKARFLEPANFPLFDIGDSDLLLVKRNGQRTCPLVYCGDSRFRLIRNRVFTELGKEILLQGGSRIATGKRHALTEVTTHKVSQTIITRQETNLPGEQKEPEIKVSGVPMSSSDFVAYVHGRVTKLHTPDQLKALSIVHSADPLRPFAFKYSVRRAPRSSPVKIVAEKETPAERSEREAFELNKENPVLR